MSNHAPALQAGSPARHRPSLAWTVFALIVAVPTAGVSLFRAVPAEWPLPVVQLVAFTPWLVIPAALALVLGVVGHRVWVIITTAALMAAQLFWLFPFDAGKPERLPDGTPTVSVKVMSLNTEFGQADAAGIVQLVRENGVQLLALQEHTQALEDRLQAAGLKNLLPQRVSDPRDDAGGGAVYSVFPLEPDGLLPDTPFHMAVTRVLAADPKTGQRSALDLTNVHALPPVDERIEQWRSDLAKIGRQASSPGTQLLMGDFNASYDHAEFREMLDSGNGGAKLVDVGTAATARFSPTWPMEGPLLPGTVLDHVVTSSRISSSGYQVQKVPGSDHAAVLATLAVPAG
ncbi:endonuclease/exonuclease/phosphatase family protein [Paenarthrobacter nicotinovorans]|uniref:endonuclease/exonuclease/phosphatase family protein n=1 Tax=Paenarthrobacter nicotinovorans TaxID=29320 RepID=UPI0037F3B40B